MHQPTGDRESVVSILRSARLLCDVSDGHVAAAALAAALGSDVVVALVARAAAAHEAAAASDGVTSEEIVDAVEVATAVVLGAASVYAAWSRLEDRPGWGEVGDIVAAMEERIGPHFAGLRWATLPAWEDARRSGACGAGGPVGEAWEAMERDREAREAAEIAWDAVRDAVESRAAFC
jgi:hypothetical protein